jgi:hypothetical protein
VWRRLVCAPIFYYNDLVYCEGIKLVFEDKKEPVPPLPRGLPSEMLLWVILKENSFNGSPDSTVRVYIS